jgi:inhibitor of KinA sporulation pathway (predicted exonuclease)
MLAWIAKTLTKIQQKRLEKATDLLIELERLWEFEWEHTERREQFYVKKRTKLERLIERLRTNLGYSNWETAD